MHETQLPTLGTVPFQHNPDLVLKITSTGVTFMGHFQKGEFHQGRRFRARYSGSKTCAVDINGNLWLQRGELEKSCKKSAADRENRDKKKGGGHPPKKTIKNAQQISEIPVEPAKKLRKKSYSVNKKEVRQRLLAMRNTQRGSKELYFWTVSFPANTSDDLCYQAFNTWLTSLRKYKMLKHYLWVCERQEIGTIHFHIAIPHRMCVQRANAMMRGTLKNMAKEGLIPYSAADKQIRKYNGVDIAKNRKTKRVTNFAIKKGERALTVYLTKYVTKNDTEFTHLAWHNSRAFSALFTGVTFTLAEFTKLGFHHFLNRVRIFKMEFATFIPWLYGPPPIVEDHLFQLNTYVQTVLFTA
jgi:hypothetical protein